ncbi:unnamed protein product [Spirodela intermedia]|uniref:PSII 6.1 kDa protein n=1 Tax=Spirodela intermedia TaxID=51605 RepID=A0A7I8IM00_SPIIN|nr:unnamed protein product [Spirodela intermedia]CAA6658995.1 unnamed protein product [Spirodela intermedia]
MAAATVNSVVTCAVVRTAAIYGASSPPVLGLPAMARARGGRVRCSISEERAAAPVSAAAALLAAAAAGVASPAMALVDERLSTEGTGLSLGSATTSWGGSCWASSPHLVPLLRLHLLPRRGRGLGPLPLS